MEHAVDTSCTAPVRAGRPRRGAFVCSLDFELLWGVRDLYPRNDVHATWATVGFVFASCRDELRAYWPAEQPAYADPGLSPYADPVGRDERDDPLRFGASLVEAIRATPGQEIGTHTFSHYYCLEPGDRKSTRLN